MRIAYLSGSTIPSTAANSVHVMRMCHALSAQGHSVTLYARTVNDDGGAPHGMYGVPRSFPIRRIPVVEVEPDATVRKWTRAVKYAQDVRRALVTDGPFDLIYARDLLSLTRSVEGAPAFVYEAHEPPKNAALRHLESRLFRHANFRRLVVISAALADAYKGTFPQLREDQLTIAHDAAGQEPSTTVAEPPEADRPLRIGYAGSLYEGRGVEVLAQVAAARPRFEVHIIGGTHEALRTWQDRKTPKNLIFHGHVPHRDVAMHLKEVDVLAAPYQRKVGLAHGGDTSRWMSPLKLFEYMASGRPIVCSDLPVLREVMTDGRNALLVPCDDADAWCAAFDRLRSDPVVFRSIARQALDDVRKYHTWDQRAQRVIRGLAGRQSKPESPLVESVT